MIVGLDHLVLTVRGPAATRRFYVDGLGMRHAHFGGQKLSLHPAGTDISPQGAHPQPGSADFCLLTGEALEDLARRMSGLGHAVILGPVPRTGASGRILSLHFRDPDGNLVEVTKRLDR